MSLNSLRDRDSNVGFYIVGAPTNGAASGWGASLWRSSDNGTTYQPLGRVPAPAVMGVTTSLLAAPANGSKKIDRINSVIVQLAYGTLSTISHTLFMNKMHMAVIGDEIIVFRDAVLNMDGTYTLSYLMRGVRGSEYAMGTHAIGDRFVLANPATMRRIEGSSSDIGKTWLFKGLTHGQALAAAASKAYTFDGGGLMPYAAGRIGGGRDASGNLTINWLRRNRISAEWRSRVDIPMSEATEAYEVDIFSDNTYTTKKRTIKVTSHTAAYTAAQQTTDFGSPQATVYFTIYQISATVGRGYPAVGAI